MNITRTLYDHIYALIQNYPWIWNGVGTADPNTNTFRGSPDGNWHTNPAVTVILTIQDTTNWTT